MRAIRLRNRRAARRRALRRAGAVSTVITVAVANLVIIIPGLLAPAGAASATWSQSITLRGGSANCGTFQSIALPATTTSITSLAVAGAGGGSAASSGGGASGAGGFGGQVSASTVTVPATVPAFLNAEVGCGGLGGAHGTTSGTSAGGGGGAGWAAGGGGGNAIDSTTGTRDGGGGGGGGSALCFGTASTTNCGAGSGTATPIAIASGGGGGGASGKSGTGSIGGGGGSGGGTAGGGGRTATAGTASTGGANNELYVTSGATGQGSGGGGGGGGEDAAGGGGGGATGGAGAVGADTTAGNRGTAGGGGTNTPNPKVGTAGGAGTGKVTCTTAAAVGGTTTSAAGGAGGNGGSFSSTSSGDFIGGGGGGGGGYTGGGGGACDTFNSNSSSTSDAGAAGGAGALWVNNTFAASPTFANAASATSSGATCTPSSANVGQGGANSGTAGAGSAGCAGSITFTISGNAVSITAPSPTVTAGSTSVSIPVTYNAGSPFSGFAITSWVVSCASGGTLTAAGSGVGANQTATITGTAPTVAGSTACTLTANSGDSTNGANAYQNQVAFTLVVNPAAATHLAFTPATPGPGTAGSAIPSVGVSVLDQFNNVVTSQTTGTVTMSILAGGPQAGFTSGTTTVNVASGVASFSNLVVNAAGSYTFVATPTSIAGVTAVNSNAFTVGPAAENKLAVTTQPSSPITAGGTVSVGVTIEDTFGNTVTTGNTGSTDTLVVALSSGSFAAGTTSVAAVNGVANFSSLQINSTAGSPYTINVTDSTHGTVTAAATNQIVVNAAAANKLVFGQGPSTVGAGAAMTPAVTVQVQDSFGNLMSSDSGRTVTLTPSAGSINSGATATTTAGVATFGAITINTAATGLTLVASATGPTSTPASSSFNVTAGAVSSLVFGTQPSNVTAGVSMSPPVTVTAKDAFNNPISGASVTLSSSVTINAGATAATNASGVATFSGIQINTAATGLTLTATSGAVTSAASASFNVTAGAANKLGFVQQPSGVTAGVAMTPAVSVQVQDSFGNPVASNGVAITLTGSTSAIVSGNTATTDASGLATFSGITINAATASETMTATAPGLTSPASSAFAVTAAAANKLGFAVQPSNVAAGIAMSPAVTVQIQDQFGNAVASNGVLITLAPSASTIASGSTATTAANGLATFSAIKFNTVVSGLTLTASSTTPALSSGASTSFNVTPGAAAKLIFLQGPSNVVAGVTMTLAVTVVVQDAFGNVVTGDTGRPITLTPSLSVINSGGTANTASGVATFNAIKINSSATGITLVASASGLISSPNSNAFDVTPAAATKLAFVQNPSNVAAGVSMSPAVTVQVEDQFTNNVPGAGVSIVLQPSSGTINAGATASTNAAGLATFSGIQINTAATGLSLLATSTGLTAAGPTITFNVTAAAANRLAFVQNPSNVVAGASMPAVTVQVQDQFGNATTTSGVTVTLAVSAGTIASGNSTTTAANGLATFSAIKINLVATGLTLTASASGLASTPASSAFNVTPAAANKFVFVQGPSDVVAGVSMNPAVTVQVQDQFGNFVSSDNTDVVTLTLSSGAIASGNTATAASGIATFSAIKINTAANGLTMTGSATGLTSTPASSSFNVTSAGANKLGFIAQPSNVTAGVAMSPSVTVQVQDQFGNSVASNGVVVVVAPSAGSIVAGNTATTAASGLATFGGITSNTSATGLTLTASASGLATSAASSAFNVTAAAANKLAFAQQPSDVAVATSMAPSVTVQVQDQFGNVVTTDTGRTITLAVSSGTIASGNTANTASGVATFSAIKINTATAGLALTGTATGLTGAGASSSFTVYVTVAPGAALTDTATDADSGVNSVTYYYCSGFAGSCTSGTGTLIGSSTTAAGGYPFTWSSTPANGAYRLVAVGTDNVTNVSTASAPIPVTVLNQAAQTITFTSTPPAAGKIGNTYAVTATATSGLTVAITLDATSTGCTRSGNTITFTAAGTCVIDANQAGNGSFFAAPQVQQSIVVNPALVVTSITSTNAGTITPGTSSETITFNNPLNPATVPTSGTITLSSACTLFGLSCSNTTLSIPGVTNGALDVGNKNWVSHDTSFGGATRTITYAVTMTLSNGNKTITIAVGACGSCGNLASGGTGTYKFIPATSITDLAGQTAPEFDTASTFKIF